MLFGQKAKWWMRLCHQMFHSTSSTSTSMTSILNISSSALYRLAKHQFLLFLYRRPFIHLTFIGFWPYFARFYDVSALVTLRSFPLLYSFTRWYVAMVWFMRQHTTTTSSTLSSSSSALPTWFNLLPVFSHQFSLELPKIIEKYCKCCKTSVGQIGVLSFLYQCTSPIYLYPVWQGSGVKLEIVHQPITPFPEFLLSISVAAFVITVYFYFLLLFNVYVLFMRDCGLQSNKIMDLYSTDWCIAIDNLDPRFFSLLCYSYFSLTLCV